jgi:hypothetical protein
MAVDSSRPKCLNVDIHAFKTIDRNIIDAFYAAKIIKKTREVLLQFVQFYCCKTWAYFTYHFKKATSLSHSRVRMKGSK